MSEADETSRCEKQMREAGESSMRDEWGEHMKEV